ncbi:hypothetical protein U9M48_014564 [Paspalum notatum var. saurae]|uniref:Uncharacterized protein n=1 Tax=Paspalum notatum var. saurae TaxID=547442 RepID=A0AAQ3WL01_PASNO
MPIYVLVAAEGEPELRDAPLAEHLQDDGLVDDGPRAAVLGVVQPPGVALGYVLAEVVVVRPAGCRESHQQLLRESRQQRQTSDRQQLHGRSSSAEQRGTNVPPEPGEVGLLGEEELVVLAARDDLDEGAVAGHGDAALHGLPRHHRVPLRRLQRPQVEQLAELVESGGKEKKKTEPLVRAYLVLVLGLGVGGHEEGAVQRGGEVLAEGRAVRDPDLLPLGGAPRSQEEAQAPRLAARAVDLPARLLQPCRGGHGHHPAWLQERRSVRCGELARLER